MVKSYCPKCWLFDSKASEENPPKCRKEIEGVIQFRDKGFVVAKEALTGCIATTYYPSLVTHTFAALAQPTM